MLFYTVLTNKYIAMSNRTEQEIKRDTYNLIMEHFVDMYAEVMEFQLKMEKFTTDWYRDSFYDMLEANGTFCLRNNPEAYPLSIRLDDYIVSLSHILAEKVEDIREEERYEDIFYGDVHLI